MVVRQAELKDAEQIEIIEQECFARPWSLESLQHDLSENDKAVYVVADFEGKIAGYVGIWNVFDEGQITNVAVLKEFRRQHVASALLEELIRICDGLGVKSYTLEVRESNEPAKALYEGFGFEAAGIRKNYYSDNGENAIIMWRREQEETDI